MESISFQRKWKLLSSSSISFGKVNCTSPSIIHQTNSNPIHPVPNPRLPRIIPYQIHGSPRPSPRRRIRSVTSSSSSSLSPYQQATDEYIDRSGGRGAVAARPGGPERAAAGGRRRLLDPLPRRLRIHGRLAGRRRAPPPAGGAPRLVQGRAPPRPPRPARPRPAPSGRRARRAPPLRPRRPRLRLPPRRAGPARLRPRLRLPRRRRPARPPRARPPHPLLRSCRRRADDPGAVREAEHGEIREAGVSEPLQIRALVPELLPHLLPQRQRLPHGAAQGTMINQIHSWLLCFSLLPFLIHDDCFGLALSLINQIHSWLRHHHHLLCFSLLPFLIHQLDFWLIWLLPTAVDVPI